MVFPALELDQFNEWPCFLGYLIHKIELIDMEACNFYP